MRKSRAATAVVEGHLDERLVERAIEAADYAADENQLRDAVETVVDASEIDPAGTSAALWSLQSNRSAAERLEACLGLNPARSTLALGGAIQLARAELTRPDPDLRSRIPELVRWLEGGW